MSMVKGRADLLIITTDKAPRIDMNKGGPMMRDRENKVIV
jgi:hypothetical protein